ncbi:ATP-binding protein [Streptomyces sp. DH24]|uniref:ATP-binding protein n=1 Tax=Streptomyces sp. DH24 TaxID=3040123 RepID=UPI00244310FE|nr:ATP-binding protein [Streptomyces sp. DH24]MDG9719268.1 ATP-binding protein [Streptomyces sp. DH24]
MPPTETFLIPKHRRHVAGARQRVRKVLADWGVTGELAEGVTLLANELVTNVVTHCRISYAQAKVTLTLHGTELLLEVSDPDRDRLPRLREPHPDQEGGRGLALVAALAEDWGWRQDPYTKCVWARITLAGTEAHVPAGS